MANRTVFEDRALGTGVFEGDLKYGRCHGRNFNRHKDYAANREEGSATNIAAAPLLLIRGRDPRVWSKQVRERNTESFTKSKHGCHNSTDFVYKVIALMTKSKAEGGLSHSVSRISSKTSWI
jgi:hypothetical protein